MKLTRLDLASFRSYRKVSLDLNAPRILIAGLNGSGKTGIKNALRWALTGHCDGTDARGAGAEVLIPTGEDYAEVTATIAAIGKAQRIFNGSASNFGVDTFTGSSQIQQQALYIKLGTTPEFLDAVLDTDAFLRLNHVEGKALVLSLLGVKIQVGDQAYTLDQLDAKYRQAFEERKHAKKLLAGILLPTAPAAEKMPTVEAIEAQLKTLRASLGDLRQTVGATHAKREELQRALKQQPVVDGEDLTASITDLEAQIAALEARVIEAPAPPAATDTSGQVRALSDKERALSIHDPRLGCVLDCKVPCTTPQTAFRRRAEEVTAVLQELRSRLPQTPQASQENPLTAARRRLDDLKASQREYESQMKAAHDWNQRRETMRQELDGLPSTEAQDAEIATLQGRITKGETLLAAARAHWQALADYQKAIERKAAAEQEVVRLEQLVEDLGPKGARVTALGDAMGKFEAAVNPYVQPFGWTIRFSVDPWDVLANDRPVETYSRSERYRIGIALQLGIAQLSGLNFAVIDEVDMLDVANRKAVSAMLMKAPLEQILILGTRETSQELKPMKGVIAYRLVSENGVTTIAEQVAA